jgi:acetyl-CoA carboxylase biotin carboxylase subunit
MYYDPLVGKVIQSGIDRPSNLTSSALEEIQIEGIKTNIPALIGVLRNERFRSGDYDTGLLGK